MKRTSLILLTICSINLLATEEPPQPESIKENIFRKKKNSCRLNTGTYHHQESSSGQRQHYSKTYFNYKQNNDSTITLSCHCKNYGYAATSYKHKVTLSMRDLAHLEALHRCYLNSSEKDRQYCTQIAGKTITNMHQEITAFIPLFFEYLEQLREQQEKS